MPCKRHLFIKKLKKLGFNGPYSGSKHQFMVFKNGRLTIPSNSEYSAPQLRMMLGQVERIIEQKISVTKWNAL